jgi:hypothetical protein
LRELGKASADLSELFAGRVGSAVLDLQVGVVRLTFEVPPDVELIFESEMGIALVD